MDSSHHGHPWLRLYSRNRSSCCSIVWACAWRWVETRTYTATLILLLLRERFRWVVLQNRCTPLDKILVTPIPSRLSVGTRHRVTLNPPLPLLHVYPPEGNFLCCFPQKDILRLSLSFDERSRANATRRAATFLSGSCRFCHL